MTILRFSMLAIGALFLEFSLRAETPLATISESTNSLSTQAGSHLECIDVFKSGTARVLIRDQVPTAGPLTLLVYRTSLTPAQLEDLRRILNSKSVEELPTFRPQVHTTKAVSDSTSFFVIADFDGVRKQVGFLHLMASDGSNAATLDESIGRREGAAEQALNPLRKWFANVKYTGEQEETYGPDVCQTDR